MMNLYPPICLCDFPLESQESCEMREAQDDGREDAPERMSIAMRLAMEEAEKIAEIADFRELTKGYNHTYKLTSTQGFYTGEMKTEWVSMAGGALGNDQERPNLKSGYGWPQEFLQHTKQYHKINSIPNVEERGITLRQLRAIVANIDRRCFGEKWTDKRGKLLTPETVTLHDVNRYIIKPFTFRSRRSLVEELPSTQGPQYPRFFSNHWWGEPVKEFVLSLESRLREFPGEGMTEETPVWIRAYANNQWEMDVGVIEETKETIMEAEELNRKLRYETEARERAEAKLKEMSAMVEQAQALAQTNDKLHRSLLIEMDKRKELHNKLEDMKGRIRVYVRVRPMLSSRGMFGRCKEALIKEDSRVCVMHDEFARDDITKTWEFDQIFGGSANEGNSQADIFKDTKNLVTSAVDGFNVCIFAYGQTGSGKTHTMFGPTSAAPLFDDADELDVESGLAPRAAVELFKVLREREESYSYTVEVNMFELYNDKIIDLLAISRGVPSQALRVKLAEHCESGLVEVDGAMTEEVSDAQGLLDIFTKGTKIRSTAATRMNADSSRSHLIISIVMKMVKKKTGCVTSGKLTLCDLAGSERVGKSGSEGRQLKEAQSINKSLSALNGVINSLTTGSRHIPYRNHPLTMLMSDSMGGNSKTLMFVCCSPEDDNCAESTNSLEFAKRCKNVTNIVKPTAGDIIQIKKLKAEVSRLKKQQYETLKKNRTNMLTPTVHQLTQNSISTISKRVLGHS